MLMKYVFKKHVKNCLLCAIRPLLYIGFTITYIGKAECKHFSSVDKPRIKENIITTALARICNLVLLADVVYVLIKLFNSEYVSVQPVYYKTIILPNFINTLNYTFCVIKNNKSYIKYTNGLIMLIDKRKFFGIDSILTKNITKSLQIWCSICFFFNITTCILFLVTTTPKEFTVESILLALSMLVNNLDALAFGAYSITTLMIYKVFFSSCFDSIYKTLNDRQEKDRDASFVRRLQYQQQFYITACSNYKKHVFGFGNVFFYSGQLVFSIISLVQAYFFTFEPMETKGGYWFIFFSNFFHVYLAVFSYAACVQATSIELLSQDLISYLYKYKISKLNEAEASQVEMLLISLIVEKPILTASHLYTLGIEILASASGTAITYVLVALQFHASFSTS